MDGLIAIAVSIGTALVCLAIFGAVSTAIVGRTVRRISRRDAAAFVTEGVASVATATAIRSNSDFFGHAQWSPDSGRRCVLAVTEDAIVLWSAAAVAVGTIPAASIESISAGQVPTGGGTWMNGFHITVDVHGDVQELAFMVTSRVSLGLFQASSAAVDNLVAHLREALHVGGRTESTAPARRHPRGGTTK